MESDEKLCPKCAEPIKKLAVVCKHCGANFEENAKPVISPEQAKKHRLRNGCIGIVAAGAGLFFLGSLANKSQTLSAPQGAEQAVTQAEPSNDVPSAPATINAIGITDRQLDAAYNANEASAQQQYGDTPLMVSGTIKSINLDFTSKTYLVLSGGNMFLGPQAELSEASAKQAPNLHKGEKVKILCTGKTQFVIGTVHMSDCELQ